MKDFSKYNIKGLLKKIVLSALLFLISTSEMKSQGMIITQCAKDMVKGLDSLVKGLLVTSCHPVIQDQHRTILSANCSMVSPGNCPPSTGPRVVFPYRYKYYGGYFSLFWHVQKGPPSYFAYYGLCTPTTFTIFPDTNCAAVLENNVDWIKIKKIVGATLVDENVLNITEIKNPRLANPLSPFWPFISPSNLGSYNTLGSAMGVLVDITVGTNTYVGMIEHAYTNNYIQWKSPIPCPTLASLNITSVPTPSACSKYQFNVNVNNVTPGPGNCPDAYWNFGDGSPLSSSLCVTGPITTQYNYFSPGTYTASAIIAGPGSCYTTMTSPVTVTCSLPCTDCISSFAPEAGKKYIVSAWVKEGGASQSTTTYSNPKISIQYTPTAVSGPFSPSGTIIDGWQRVESEFLIPVATTNIGIKLDCISGNCFFDDIRIFPVDGSMKSYVYDPVNMRLVAELDERNYATFYEYDEEGKLIRVKKETEKGKMTIQENRNNTKKP